MKKLLLINALILQFNSFSQITLTKADFADGGDTVRMSKAMDNGYDFLATGTDYVWDFSSLIPTEQIVKDFSSMNTAPSFVQFLFGNFAPVKYQATYFTPYSDLPITQITSILPIGIENVYQFSKLSDDSLTSLGYTIEVQGNAVPLRSDTIEKRYEFPLTYGQSYSSRGYTAADFNPIIDAQWVQYRQRNSHVDGWGTLKTPYGTFNTLRMKHEIEEVDSIYLVLPVIGGQWIPLNLPKRTEYEWWTNGEKEPVLKIVTSALGGNETVTDIEYRDINRYLDLGINEHTTSVGVYPNPIQNKINIASKNPIETISVFDVNGKEIYHLQGGQTTMETIDLSFLENGFYRIQITTSNELFSKSFVKQ